MQNREGKLMSEIVPIEGVGIFETNGTNIYKRSWNEDEGTYYNQCLLRISKQFGWSFIQYRRITRIRIRNRALN